MTKLKVIGVAVVALAVLVPEAMARGGGAARGGMRGAVVGGMAGGSEGAKTGAKVGVVAGATRGVAGRTADRQAIVPIRVSPELAARDWLAAWREALGASPCHEAAREFAER